MTLRSTMPRRALFATLIACAGSAWAMTCAVVPGASELSIADLGRVVFLELATDRAADAAIFGGGVCLELADQRVVIEAERFEVVSFAAAPRVLAHAARVRSDGWTLYAERLELDAVRLLLVDAALETDDVVALARRFEIALPLAVVRGWGLVAATSEFRLDLAEAEFDGTTLSGTAAVLSSCDCPPSEAGVRIESERLWLSLVGDGLELVGGSLVAGVVRVPLPRTWRLDQRDLERLVPPLALARDDERGWLLVVPERRRDGVSLEADVALERDVTPPWRVAIGAEDASASAAFEATRDSAAARVAAEVRLAPWLTLLAEQRLELGEAERFSDAALSLRAHLRPDLGAGVGLQHLLRGEVGVALSAELRGGTDVVGPRAWSVARWETTTPSGGAGRLRLAAEVGTSGYLVADASQWWWAVAPRWTLARDAWTLELEHEQRAVYGASPFGTVIDRVVPRSRSTLSATARVGTPATRLDAQLRVDWRDDTLREGRVGLERARVSLLTPAFDIGGGGELRVRGTLEMAGRIDPRPRRDAFVAVGLAGRWPERGVELGLDATVGLLREATSLRNVIVSVAAPLPGMPSGLEARPFLALDVLPPLRSEGWPSVRGHGLELSWETPYGIVDVGYRSEIDGSLGTSVGLRLPARTPTLDDLRR